MLFSSFLQRSVLFISWLSYLDYYILSIPSMPSARTATNSKPLLVSGNQWHFNVVILNHDKHRT